jgi:hypothetical protein
VENLDKEANAAGLDEEGWALRYHLEDQLLQLDKLDEEYCRQRSRLNLTLKGDSNTAFFHAIANGRRRKCQISRLLSDQGEIEGQQALTAHIYQFYQGLMGAIGEVRAFSLAPNLWDEVRGSLTRIT